MKVFLTIFLFPAVVFARVDFSSQTLGFASQSEICQKIAGDRDKANAIFSKTGTHNMYEVFANLSKAMSDNAKNHYPLLLKKPLATEEENKLNTSNDRISNKDHRAEVDYKKAIVNYNKYCN